MFAAVRAVPSLRTCLRSGDTPARRQPGPPRRGRCIMVTQHGILHPDVQEVLLTKEAIAARVEEVGREIAEDYADKQPIIVGTLKGAILFLSDLVRAIEPVPAGLQLEFVRASSYGAATVSSGKVALNCSIGTTDVKGRHVLLVEDIVDSGRTAAVLMQHYRDCGAASVKMASLLSKPSRRVVEFEPDYLCFEVEDKFVVGFGLDFNEHYRSLPYIGVLKPECYTPAE